MTVGASIKQAKGADGLPLLSCQASRGASLEVSVAPGGLKGAVWFETVVDGAASPRAAGGFATDGHWVAAAGGASVIQSILGLRLQLESEALLSATLEGFNEGTEMSRGLYNGYHEAFLWSGQLPNGLDSRAEDFQGRLCSFFFFSDLAFRFTKQTLIDQAGPANILQAAAIEYENARSDTPDVEAARGKMVDQANGRLGSDICPIDRGEALEPPQRGRFLSVRSQARMVRLQLERDLTVGEHYLFLNLHSFATRQVTLTQKGWTKITLKLTGM